MDNFLKRLRISEGDDQLDLFPTERRPNFFMRHLPFFVVAIVIVLMFVTAGHSADLRRVPGTFCETPESAAKFLSAWDGQNAVEVVDGVNIVAGKEICILTYVVMDTEVVHHGEPVVTETGTWQMIALNVWGYQLSGIPVSVYLPSPRTMYTFIQVAPPVAETHL